MNIPQHINTASSKPYASRLIYLPILLALLFHLPAFTDPVEDMKNGEAAFNRADLIVAIGWFRKAAEAGYAPAQARLAGILDYSENNEEAAIWYRKAAEQNNADGQYGLGYLYAAGDGVKQDHDQAVHWLGLAAEQGHAQAIRTLVTAYEKGGLGLEKDTSKAVELLKQAAEKNDSWSKNRLKNKYPSN